MLEVAHSFVFLQCTVWWQYARACGCWGAAYSGAAIVAQAMATAADFWLMRTTAEHAEHPLTSEQVKETTVTHHAGYGSAQLN